MNPILALFLLFILFAVWIVYRARSAAPKSQPQQRPAAASSKRSTDYHAVSIRFASSACEAAKTMKDRRFVSSAAPRLPLPECDVLECKCRFVHYADRRTGEDRRNPFAGNIGGATGEHKVEKRRLGDRRAEPPDIF